MSELDVNGFKRKTTKRSKCKSVLNCSVFVQTILAEISKGEEKSQKKGITSKTDEIKKKMKGI